MRTSIYKNKILDLLKKNHLLSISDIHKNISGADFSTIYRNIEYLVLDKEIKKVVLDKDVVVYELNDKLDQHDHFLCIDCGEVEGIKVSSKNLLLNSHKVEDILIRGLCSDCNKV